MAVGGVTLAAKGQREFSGREISQLEVKAEAATEKITKVTKKTTGDGANTYKQDLNAFIETAKEVSGRTKLILYARWRLTSSS